MPGLDVRRRKLSAVPLRQGPLWLSHVLLGLALAVLSPPAEAQETVVPPSATSDAEPLRLLGLHYTLIRQHLYPFPSPYNGPNSLVSDGDDQTTQSYGVSLGWRLADALHAFLDVEVLRGQAVSQALGLAALPNGDELRVGTVNLGQGPYVARAYLRTWIALAGSTERAQAGPGELAVPKPVRRLEFKLGKLAATDDFDQNRYANSTRLQFMNWALINNTAWDFAADTRGYSNGIVTGWVRPGLALHLGVFQMPTFANGNMLDGDLARARGENVQLTLGESGEGGGGGVLRLLAYRNLAKMGSYREALARGRPPDIAANDEPGRIKYGWALSAEQPLAHGGETGVFLRAGWNDGKTESFAYTEADEHLSLGVQVSGAVWGRATDVVGLGGVVEGLSPDHRAYLEAGGVGFVLGDGRLNYGRETVVEAYYRLQLGRLLYITPDYQAFENPGFNRDRGPVHVVSLRVRLAWPP